MIDLDQLKSSSAEQLPSITVLNSNGSATAFTGQSFVDLEFSVEGNPEPVISWHRVDKNDERIVPSAKFEVISFDQ